jgi:PelA/Pel-15E family pectate lyase
MILEKKTKIKGILIFLLGLIANLGLIAIIILSEEIIDLGKYIIGLLVATFILIIPITTMLMVFGIRLIHIATKSGPMMSSQNHKRIAKLYSFLFLAGLIIGIISLVVNYPYIRDILWLETMLVLYFGGIFLNTILASKHLAVSKGKEFSNVTKAIKTRYEAYKIAKKPVTTTEVQDVKKDEKQDISSRAHNIGSFYALSIMIIIITGGLTFYSTYDTEICNNHGVSFSTPPYDLQTINTTAHFNLKLDNITSVNQTLLKSLEKGMWAMTKTQHVGGFPMTMLPDGSAMYSDRGSTCPLFADEFSLQGGTAKIASVYLEMYLLEPNPVYLKVATEAADALLAVQDQIEGGFYYDGKRHDDGTGYQPHPHNMKRAAILDDDVMQSSMRFLLDVYNITKEQKYLDGIIKGFKCLDNMEKPGGGWPQRSNHDADEYASYVTLNDDSMEDVVMLMLKAYDLFNESKYLAAAERAGQFIIRVQGKGGSSMQTSWGQQYNNDVPVWARRFEPPAMCSSQTASAIEMLIELYLISQNTSYLAPIQPAIDWLTHPNTTIQNPTNPAQYYWSRLYELKTNLPIVGNRNNQNNGVEYYYDYDPVRDFGYSWQSTFGINTTIDKYSKLLDLNNNSQDYINWRSTPSSLSTHLSRTTGAYNKQNVDGFWLNSDGNIKDGDFSGNAHNIIAYFQLLTK